MRGRPVLLAMVLPLSVAWGVQAGVAHPDEPAKETARHQCRVQWRDLTSYQAENGNPRGAVPELVARWDAFYAGAQHYIETATRNDCGPVIEGYRAEWEALEAVQYDLWRYDTLTRLAGAEGDREHALDLQHTEQLSPRLERQFAIARKHARPAAMELTPALGPFVGIDVTDAAAVAAAFEELEAVADASRHLRKLERALRVILSAELHEE